MRDEGGASPTVEVMRRGISKGMPRPRKPAAQKRAALAVYLPPALLKKLQRVATRERRSASAQALLFIEGSLKE